MQTRAFCCFDDLVDGFVRTMATPRSVAGPVNLGNPHEIPVRDLAGRIVTPGDGLARGTRHRGALGQPG
jgi:UDP-glucuronate decarboxylase